MTLNEFLHQLVPPIYWNGTRYLGDKLREHGLLRVKEADPALLQRRRALEKAHRAANISCAAHEIALRPGRTVQIHPNSRVAFEPFCFQRPEMVDELDFFRRETAGLSRFLDIGALHGIFSIMFALDNTSGRCLAVDASPIAFSRLLYNLEKNSLRGRITPIECAVTDKSGSLRMHYEWEHAVAAPGGDSSRTLEVQAVSGTDLCRAEEFDPDVIKIDVEGHEVSVLRGLEPLIARTKPVVFLEIHPPRVASSGERLDFFDSFARRHAYRSRTMNGEPFRWQDLSRGDSEVRVQLVPEKKEAP
jgi:FkbM family methyltransferase